MKARLVRSNYGLPDRPKLLVARKPLPKLSNASETIPPFKGRFDVLIRNPEEVLFRGNGERPGFANFKASAVLPGSPATVPPT
jgi:hypothetical protein